jgi:hypothetical protein
MIAGLYAFRGGRETTEQPEAKMSVLLKQPQALIEAKPLTFISPLGKGRENKRETLNRSNPSISPFEKGREIFMGDLLNANS